MNKLEQNQGRAKSAFTEAVSRTRSEESAPQRKSMTTRFAIEEGPRPPWIGQIVQRQAFERRWEESGRAARAAQAGLKFANPPGRTLESKQTRLRKNFNRQSGIDNGIGR